MPGPAPKKNRRGRNPLAFPFTQLPAAGRKGGAPKLPAHVSLGRCGLVWWRWAWKTPQAAAWNAGHVAAVVRRAQLEDVWAEAVVAHKAGAALAGALRQLDDTLGLTPKGMQNLRWELAADELAEAREERAPGPTSRRLVVVDPNAVAGG